MQFYSQMCLFFAVWETTWNHIITRQTRRNVLTFIMAYFLMYRSSAPPKPFTEALHNMSTRNNNAQKCMVCESWKQNASNIHTLQRIRSDTALPNEGFTIACVIFMKPMFRLENPKARHHSEDLGVDRKVILEWILEK